MSQLPTLEDLAELSRLHNDLRDLRARHLARRDFLFEPIREATLNIQKQLTKEFSEPIEQIKAQIRKIRIKNSFRRTCKSLDFRYEESWKK